MSVLSRALLRNYVIGICMGTADGVPGVSGGTIALIAGVYSRLINSITALTPKNGLRLVAAFLPPDYKAIREILEEVDAVFLLPLGVGILTAILIVTRAVEYADEHYPILLFGFFFGLIAASVVVLARQVTLSEPRHYTVALTGFLLAFLVSGDITLLQGHSMILVFISGAIAVSAMILPGISGSLILILLGQYVFMTETLTLFTDRAVALLSGGTVDYLVDPGTTVAVFLVGGIVGLLTIARIVERALNLAPELTLVFLVSLVLGALRAPITEISSKGIGWTTNTVGTFGLAAFVGAVLLYGLEHYAIDVEIDAGKATNQ